MKCLLSWRFFFVSLGPLFLPSHSAFPFATKPPKDAFEVFLLFLRSSAYPRLLPLALCPFKPFLIDFNEFSTWIHQVSNIFLLFPHQGWHFLFPVPEPSLPLPLLTLSLSSLTYILKMTLLVWFISWLVHNLDFVVFLAFYLCYSLGLWVVLFTLVLIFLFFENFWIDLDLSRYYYPTETWSPHKLLNLK